MAGMIYLPPPPNPWAQSLNQVGTLLQNLALAKTAQNFREKEEQIEADREAAKEARLATTRAKMEGWRVAAGEEQRAPGSGAIDIYGTKMMPPAGPELTPEEKEQVGIIRWFL